MLIVIFYYNTKRRLYQAGGAKIKKSVKKCSPHKAESTGKFFLFLFYRYGKSESFDIHSVFVKEHYGNCCGSGGESIQLKGSVFGNLS